MALAYPGWQVDFGFLAWFGLIPLLWSVKISPESSDRHLVSLVFRSKFTPWLITGLVYFLITFRWFWFTHPLDGLGISNKFASLLIILLIYSTSVMVMASFWCLAGWLSLKIKKDSGLLVWLVLPSLFVLVEYARTFGFGAFWYGSGTLLGPHWTMGNPVYALSNNSLALWLSSYVGIYGVLFFLVFVNLIIYHIIFSPTTTNDFSFKKLFNLRFLMASVVFLGFVIFPKLITHEKINKGDKKINYALIQTIQPTKIIYSPAEKLTDFKKQLNFLNQLAREKPQIDLIVFPETSDFFRSLSLFLNTDQVQTYFNNLFEKPVLIISGARILNSDGRASARTFYLDSKNDIVAFHDKRLLAPFGEFLPYPIRFVVNLISKNKISEFGDLRELAVGQTKTVSINFHDQFQPIVIVCSELLSPSLFRNRIKESDLVTVLASTAIFHGNPAIIGETMAIARFRAAENKKPLILAANMGLSYSINRLGGIENVTTSQKAQILTGSLVLNPRKSLYNKVGDWPILLVSVLVLAQSWINKKDVV